MRGRAFVRRLATAVVTLFLVTVLVFLLAHLSPGDAVTAESGDEAARRLSPERVAQIRALYHLDEPFHRQYLLWLSDVVRGDLGRSFHDRRPVLDKIAERIGITLTLNVVSLLLTVVAAVPLGVLAALRPGSRLDRWTATGGYALYAVPVFWAALVLQIVFAVRLDWFPLQGLSSFGAETHGAWVRFWDRAAHLVLPVICLSYTGIAYLSRFVRANLLENALFESVRAARARGMTSRSILWRHGFRQASVPLLTLAGFVLPALVSGSVIVEQVFSIPGLGRLFVDAMLQRDIPTVMGLTLLSAVATLLGILAADLAYTVFDPRTRRG